MTTAMQILNILESFPFLGWTAVLCLGIGIGAMLTAVWAYYGRM